MRLNQHFITGRVRKRMLRPPLIEGWCGDEGAGHAPERAVMALARGDEGLILAPGGGHAPVPVPAAIAEQLEPGLELMVGWPLGLAVLRRAGVMLAAEGDVTHFGRCHLDPLHAVERTGYEYLASEGVEVRVELALSLAGEARTVMLGPGETATLGPYRIEHLRSYDPGDRPGPAKHPAYAFRIRRTGDAPLPARPAGVPHPLEVSSAAEVAAAARARGLLAGDETLAAEPDQLARHLDRYEGPRHALEETLRETGPTPPAFTRAGEVAVVACARLTRGSHGEPSYGRARLALHPAGIIEVERSDLGTAPGRLRKATHGE